MSRAGDAAGIRIGIAAAADEWRIADAPGKFATGAAGGGAGDEVILLVEGNCADGAEFVVQVMLGGVGIFEASWDLPRSYQDLEVFGTGGGSVYMQNGKVELRNGKESKEVKLDPLPPDRAEPIAYMVSCIRDHRPIEGLTALDINVDVVEIIDAAKESVKTGKSVRFSEKRYAPTL